VANEYDFASEQKHSNSILLAHNKFKIDGEWYTFIDYEKFHELVQKYEKNGIMFSSMDYIAKTPSWALYGTYFHAVI
jgi:tRNA wybutosine-synthesizing protein 1